MLSINDQVHLEIKIDGDPIPSGHNVVNRVDVCSGGGKLFPTAAMTLSDGSSAFSRSRALTEGNPIDILLSRSHKDANYNVHKFRFFGSHKIPTPAGQDVRIVAIINTPVFINKAPSIHIEGTSEDALRKIATDCGLKFSGPSDFNGRKCDDKQVWLLMAQKYCSAALDIARHGMIDKQSCMALALTSQGELRYRNLIDVLNKPPSEIDVAIVHATLPSDGDSGKRQYFARDPRDVNFTGLMANYTNYGTKRVTNNTDGDIDLEEKVDVNTGSKALPINSDVKGKVETTRVEYSPRDCGNTHKNYERAEYQNRRLLALFSQKLVLLVDLPTGLELYDPVIYRQADVDPSVPLSQNDVYIVTGKTIAIRGGRFYCERLEIAKIGTNMAGNSSLITPKNSGPEANMIPDVSLNPLDSSVMANSAATAKGLGQSMSTIQQGTSVLQSVQQSSIKGVLAATGPIASAVNAMDAGLGSAEKSILGAIDAAQGAYNSMEDAYKHMEQQALDIKNMALSVPQNLSANARQIMSTATGGVISTLGAMLPIVNQQSLLGKVVNKMRDKALNQMQSKLNAATLTKLDAISNKMNQQTAKMNNTFTDTWNSSVGLIDNKVAQASPTNSVNRLVDGMADHTIDSDISLKAAIHGELNSRPVRNGSNFADYKSVDGATKDIYDATDGISQINNLNTNRDGWFDA